MGLVNLVNATAQQASPGVLVPLPTAAVCRLVVPKALAIQSRTGASVLEVPLAPRAWNQLHLVRRIAITGASA